MKRKKVGFKKLFLVIVLIGGIGVLLKKFTHIEKALSVMMYPFLIMQEKVITPLKKISFVSKDYQQLHQELEECVAQRQALWSHTIELQSLLLEMQECEEMIDFKKKYHHNQGIVARVLLKNFDENHHFMVVDAGSVKGVKPDMVVVCQNFLVGKVAHVYPYYSRVILLTDKACKVAALCTATQAQGIHEGINSLDTTRLTFVSHLEELKKDDLIISAGEGLIFPRGFGLGTIESFERDGFSYRVHVKPLLDFNVLTTCYIFEKGQEFYQKP
jgi:rod shape-determining protein MreC